MTADVETRKFGVSRDDVGAIDSWVERIGAAWGASERVVFAARLCLAELSANVVEHGVARSHDDHMVVTLRRAGGGIEVEFLDSRAPFDPSDQVAATNSGSIETTTPGGRGLMLIRAYAKDLSYSHDGMYNRVRLRVSPT